MSTSLYQSAYRLGHVTASRRAEALRTWQSWGALVAMAALSRDGDQYAELWNDSVKRMNQLARELLRLDALRAWQAWTGVLAMAARTEAARTIAYWQGYDEGFRQ